MTSAWVIGGSGLLGSSLRSAIGVRAGWTEAVADRLPWDAGDREYVAAVRAGARRLAGAAAHRWAVLWAAGRTVPASDEAQAAEEVRRTRLALDALVDELRGSSGGVLFFASSAGGVYAGSAEPPFTEASPTSPTSPYGRLKLELESAFAATSEALGVPAVIGRIANLYGPGQDLSKPQGLLSHLALARFAARIASLYVPLDTIRDYLHADDAARIILEALDLAETGATTKIVASGQPATISELLATSRRVTHGRLPVVLGSSPLAARQAVDLRLRSTVWPELERLPRRGLSEGIADVAAGVLRAVQAGR